MQAVQDLLEQVRQKAKLEAGDTWARTAEESGGDGDALDTGGEDSFYAWPLPHGCAALSSPEGFRLLHTVGPASEALALRALEAAGGARPLGRSGAALAALAMALTALEVGAEHGWDAARRRFSAALLARTLPRAAAEMAPTLALVTLLAESNGVRARATTPAEADLGSFRAALRNALTEEEESAVKGESRASDRETEVLRIPRPRTLTLIVTFFPCSPTVSPASRASVIPSHPCTPEQGAGAAQVVVVGFGGVAGGAVGAGGGLQPGAGAGAGAGFPAGWGCVVAVARDDDCCLLVPAPPLPAAWLPIPLLWRLICAPAPASVPRPPVQTRRAAAAAADVAVAASPAGTGSAPPSPPGPRSPRARAAWLATLRLTRHARAGGAQIRRGVLRRG